MGQVEHNSREISGAPPLRVELAIVLVGAAALAWLLPPARAWIETHTLESRAAALIGDCRPPVEAEQLHVVVYHRDGRLVRDCMHVAARGLYAPRKPR